MSPLILFQKMENIGMQIKKLEYLGFELGHLDNLVYLFDLKMKITCIVRESNPGRPRGRRAFYH